MLMNWSPPSEYDIPAIINSSMVEGFFESLKISIQSISSTGLLVLALPVALIIVFSVIRSFTDSDVTKGVKKRSLGRKIFKADVKQNLNDILEDKMLHKEVDMLANKNFFKKNKAMLVDAQVNSMEVSHLAKQKYRKKHKNWLVDEKVDNMEINHLAEMQFSKEHSNAFGEKKDLYKSNNDKYYATHKRKQKKRGKKW